MTTRNSIGRALLRLAAKVDAGPYVTYTRTVRTPQTWEAKLASGLAGRRPQLPSMAPPRPSYWRRLWNALLGR
ncbi:hypothetical protein [Mycobacterium sp. NAZ190054]|uniref:hypothetical protein n=1 Tax=Mycobacterium sp. NAZ190054 TaxID=1747766 RepID=UPI00079C4964|nr:hypothetical protein [Mycobacterium sp. NAZ190054]KWX66814.1 hypothetical protein ASJ79_05465 [Mycobacterium sp. NAZ190054]